jgi:plasmid stabilization system protein ParE
MPVTYRVIITPRAFADLDRILTDVGAKSPSGASRLIADLLWEME